MPDAGADPGERGAAQEEASGLYGRLLRLIGGRFGRLVLPAVILQSVLVGGGYASGREVVEFGARFGTLGWASVLAIFAGFTATSILVFEFARVVEAYEYRSFMGELVGRGWVLFDVLFAAMAVLIIAVMASAAGNILDRTLGVPYLVSIAVILVVVAALLHRGSEVIEAFKTLGTTALYGGFLLFSALVLYAGWPNLVSTVQAGDSSLAPGATTFTALKSGILYVGYNLAVYPAVLFVLHRQTRGRDAVLGGALAGLVMTVPFLLTYLSVLVFYPGTAVVESPVPWLTMLEALEAPWIVGLYGLVVGWTLLETSLGLIHAILDRVDAGLARLEEGPLSGREGLSDRESGLLGAGMLAAAALLAQVGIVDLIARGYTAMAYAFIAVFAVPLLTVGTYRILDEQGWLGGLRRRLGAGEPGAGEAE